jgi:DNA invertase Pin-like site-specific DNA recombinase
MKQLRVACYVRVSTHEQSCDLQKRDLAMFIEARGWQIHAIYEDIGTGTKANNRPALKQMLKEGRERRYDVVLCWKMDRLFRSLKDLVLTLHLFEELGISFVSLRDNLDLTTSHGRLMMQICGAFAEFEASLIRERVKAGLSAAKAKGVRLGRQRRIDRERVYALRKQGLSLTQIGKLVKATKSGVSKTLKSYSIASV